LKWDIVENSVLTARLEKEADNIENPKKQKEVLEIGESEVIMNGIEQNIVVLSADKYSVDGASGTTLFYLMDTDLAPVVNDGNSLGAKPAKANLPASVFDSLTNVPARYKANFTMKANSKGVMALAVTELSYLCDLKLSDVQKNPLNK
jgi:hypothetical protein